jgi:hypothetical protein
MSHDHYPLLLCDVTVDKRKHCSSIVGRMYRGCCLAIDLHVTIFIWYCKHHPFRLSGVKGGYTNTCTHKQQGDVISLFFFNKECRLEMIWKNRVWGFGLDFTGSGQDTVADCYEHGNVPSGFIIQSWDFCDQVSDHHLLKSGFDWFVTWTIGQTEDSQYCSFLFACNFELCNCILYIY